MERFAQNSRVYINILSNEHVIPGNIVLVFGGSQSFKNIFSFLQCESVFVSDTPDSDIRIDPQYLPFEDNTFDIVFACVKSPDLERVGQKVFYIPEYLCNSFVNGPTQ
jgi:hypothetical protein